VLTSGQEFAISKPTACRKLRKQAAGLHDCFGATRLAMTCLGPALHESWQDFLFFVRLKDFINDDDG
jgi:hypothetical protein